MRRAVELPVRDELVAHAGLHRARCAAQIAGLPRAVGVPAAVDLDVIHVDDVRRPRRRFAELERLRLSLDLPRVVRPPLDPGPAEPNRTGAREPADFRRTARPVDQHLEPVRTAAQRVLLVVREVDDAVPRPELVDLLVLPGETGAAEHEHDLLRGAVRVGRGRQPSRVDQDAVDSDPGAADRVAETLPARRHLALLGPARLDLVPMREVFSRYCEISFFSSPVPSSAFIFASSSSTFDCEVSCASSRSS